MGSAPLTYDAEGRVAWDRVWRSFCDLALAGGPPHRGTLLEPPSREEVLADPDASARVVAEIARGLALITHLPVVTDAAPGWVGLVCPDEEMAVWMLRAIVVENVSVRREGATLFLPAGPAYRVEKEVKNVITAVAKTHHYWTEHRAAR
jgi:sirohydrochlorin cobaltochelatase